MNNHTQLQKDRVVYASQCYENIKLKCPVCYKEKIPRHCKIFKTPAAIWWHIKREHGEFSFKEFDIDMVVDVLNGITKAIQWGMIPK